MLLQMNNQLPVPNVRRRAVRTLVRPLARVRRHFVPLPVGKVLERPLAEPARIRFNPGVNPTVRLHLLLGGELFPAIDALEPELGRVDGPLVPLEDALVPEGRATLVADFGPCSGVDEGVRFEGVGGAEQLSAGFTREVD